MNIKIELIFIKWGLGIGDWGFGPIPNPQSPIPKNNKLLNNKQLKFNLLKLINIKNIINNIFN